MKLPQLILLGIVNSCYNIWLSFNDIMLSFRYPKLCRLLFLFFTYYPLGPWLFIKNNMREKSPDLIYGETPFFTAKKILEWAKVTSSDRFLDLGSGRGHIVFIAAALFGMQSEGIEIVGGLTRIAKIIADKLHINNVTFHHGNFIECDFSKYTVIYLAGTTFNKKTINDIAQKIKDLPQETKIISLSSPFKNDLLRFIDSNSFYFSWGKTNVYLQQRI